MSTLLPIRRATRGVNQPTLLRERRAAQKRQRETNSPADTRLPQKAASRISHPSFLLTGKTQSRLARAAPRRGPPHGDTYSCTRTQSSRIRTPRFRNLTLTVAISTESLQGMTSRTGRIPCPVSYTHLTLPTIYS